MRKETELAHLAKDNQELSEGILFLKAIRENILVEQANKIEATMRYLTDAVTRYVKYDYGNTYFEQLRGINNVSIVNEYDYDSAGPVQKTGLFYRRTRVAGYVITITYVDHTDETLKLDELIKRLQDMRDHYETRTHSQVTELLKVISAIRINHF